MIKRFAILFGALSLSLPLWADITVTPGVGKTVHTDTVNGLEYQVIKIIDGTTGGTSSMTVTAAGAAKVDGSASTQPVTLNQFNAVPVVSTYTTVVSTGLPVTGTFFQVTQPVSIGQANAVPVVSTYTTVVSTGLPVTGTFFQTTQPVSIGQANAVPVVSTYTTVVSTGLPVTGTFFQASQPVTVSQSNAIPVTSTYTTVVSTGLPVTGTFFQATQPISATIGVPVTSTYTTVVSTGIPMAGASFNGDTGLNVHLVNGGSGGPSASIPSAFPATVTPVAGINPSGNLATFAVDSSSSINVHITAGGGTGGTASSIPGAFPATVTPVAGINPSGNMATFAVDSSSGLKLSGQFAIPVTSTYTTVVSTGLPVTQSGAWSITNTTAGVVGIAAIGATAAGNPLRMGAAAHTALPAGVTDGQMQDHMLDKYGRTVTIADCPRDLLGQSTATLTSTTAETVFISSGGANVFNDIIQVVAVNTSATATRLDFSGRGGPSGQAMSFTLYLPAGDTRGMALGHIWPQNTANANWTVTSSASVSDVRIAAVYCANK